MIMEFTETPTNVLSLMYEYSPLSLGSNIKNYYNFRKKINNGYYFEKPERKAELMLEQQKISSGFARTLTGSLQAALIYGLVKADILELTGSGDEDKDVKNFEQNILGKNNFSIKIGNKYYSYDWATPAAQSFLTAQAINEAISEDEKQTLFDIGSDFLGNMGEIWLETSMLSGLRDVLTTLTGQYNDGKLDIGGAAENLITQELAKYVPSLVNQIGQYLDKNVRTSYDATSIGKTTINKTLAKIPGLSKTLAPVVDVMGNEVTRDNTFFNTFIAPWNVKKGYSTKATEEIYRLYEETGDKEVIPWVAPYTISTDNGTVSLTPEERASFQKDTGKFIEKEVTSLLTNDTYKNLSDTDKAELIKDIFSYGRSKAENKYADIPFTSSEEKIYNMEQAGIDPAQYLIFKNNSDFDNSGSPNTYETKLAIAKSGMSNKEQKLFYAIEQPDNVSKYGNIFNTDKITKGLKDVSIQEIVNLRKKVISKSAKNQVTESNLKNVLNNSDYTRLEKYAIYEILKNSNFSNPY